MLHSEFLTIIPFLGLVYSSVAHFLFLCLIYNKVYSLCTSLFNPNRSLDFFEICGLMTVLGLKFHNGNASPAKLHVFVTS